LAYFLCSAVPALALQAHRDEITVAPHILLKSLGDSPSQLNTLTTSMPLMYSNISQTDSFVRR
jgi:hypothetical protein